MKSAALARLATLTPFRPLRLAHLCSLRVLAGLGLLAAAPLAWTAGAGGVLPPNTLPVFKGLVAGRIVGSTPSVAAGGPVMTIDQASSRAILDWRSFDIGSAAAVQFWHQQGPGSVTLNRIYDANPSVIQGRLSSHGAEGKGSGGQVILINQNGILFDRGSQVNTQSLIASTLNLRMDNAAFCNNNLAACDSGAPLTAGGLLTPAFEGGYDENGNWLAQRPGASRAGNIGIGSFGPAGAAAPLLQADAGGSIVLIAARIDNDGGIIRSPDGQVILAAGSKAWLAVNDNAADLTLRGLRVEVEAAQDGPGLNLTNLVRNAGELSADRGNVTVAALAINQEGRISAKTAVQRNGSIFLTARSKDGADAGRLTLAAGSVTEVMPDTQDTATLPDSTDYKPYRGLIRAQAGVIEHHGSLVAAGGRIGLEATNLADPGAARVYLAEGSLTSVAGFWADVNASKSLATFRVTSNELKNAPDQKNGLLLGATVTVDLRDSHNILSLDGYRGAVARTVAEKAAVGGELSIGSTGSLVQRSGATIDASGGGWRHGAGLLATSTLLGDDGRIYDIGSAPQQRRYVAQLDSVQRTDTRWGQTRSFDQRVGASVSRSEAYLEGKAGGSVRIGAGAGIVLDGTLKGGVTVGPRQQTQAPQGASLSLGSGLGLLRLYDVDDRTQVVYNDENQRIGNVIWQQRAGDSLGSGFTADTALSASQRDNILIGAEQVFGAARPSAEGRVETGFGSVTINAEGRISVPADVHIQSDIGASLTLRGPALDVAGDIRLPAGSLVLDPISGAVANVQPLDFIDPVLADLAERTVVRGSAELSVAGSWLNRSGNGGAAVGELLPSGRNTASGVRQATDGGTLVVGARVDVGQLSLERGAVLDVSGGALLDSSRRLTGGRGGTLTINNGVLQQSSPDWMHAELRGHALAGGGNGGTLNLNLNQALISAPDAVGTLPSASTRLTTGLFTDTGFANFNISAAQGIEVAPGTVLRLAQQNLQIDSEAALALPSGADLHPLTQATTLPDHQRAASSLSLTAGRSAQVSTGARIEADPGASLAITVGAADANPLANAALRVDGELLAPGGRVTLTLRGSQALDAAPLTLGADARISVAGTFVATPNDAGLRQGNVFGGGSVTLDAAEAGIELAAGSRIDLSGIEQVIDQLAADGSGATRSSAVAGHAGTLLLRASTEVKLDGTLAATGPGSAAGGSFALELTRADRQTTLAPPQRLVLSADGRDAAPAAGSTTTTLSTNMLQAAGFQKLRLLSEDSIEFQGTSRLDFSRGLRLDAPEIRLGAGARVQLAGATVSLGQSLGIRTQQIDPFDVSRTVWTQDTTRPQPSRTAQPGNGVLDIAAGQVDFYGSLTVHGSQLLRVASEGDVRFIGRDVNFNVGQGTDPALKYQYGSLVAAGGLEFDAAQLYPATRTRFDVEASGSGAYLLVRGNGQTPGDAYSAAGALTLKAPTLVQLGTVRAPQGQLNLLASERLELGPGSVTSVSGAGLTVLYGTTLDGLQWRYIDGPQSTSTANPLLLDAVSSDGKRLTLSAPAVDVQSGATVDLRGGGGVMAVEFVAGNGGDNDLANAANTYAVIPKSRLASMPYDAYLQNAGLADPGSGFSFTNPRDAALYDSLQVEAGGRLPAGEYVLLPTRFALLPDAFLVQLQTGSAYRNLQPGQTSTLANGETIVAGHRSARGTELRESQSVGVVVLPGSASSRYSDYTRSGAELFVSAADRAGRLVSASPWDAAAMTVRDASTLSLAGSFLTDGVQQAGFTGRRSEIDLVGARVAIVGSTGAQAQPAGMLEISAASLSALDASVLVGGTRQRGASGLSITTLASEVSVANDASTPVDLPELTLTASQGITVAAGSVLRASGAALGTEAPVLKLQAAGALLRLSSGAQASIDRGSASSASGDISVAASATLQASGSLLLDATRSTRSAGLLRAGSEGGAGGAISLSASRVSLGQTGQAPASGLGGLVLDNEALLAYGRLDELTLRAYERIDFFGEATLGGSSVKTLTLDTPQLAAQAVAGAAHATVAADTVQWLNRSTTVAAASGSDGGSGSLEISARQLLLGAGDKASAGFGNVSLTGSASVALQGSGALRAGGALALHTPLLQAGSGANQRIAAVADAAGASPLWGSLLVDAGAGSAAAAPVQGALGGRVALQGADVQIHTRVQAHSGRIAVTAQGGDVTLGAAAVLDAAGESRNFNGSIVAADAGSVALVAETGRVQTAAGSRIDIGAAAAGGNAGLWQLRAGEAALQGSVNAAAGSAAGAASRGGSADIDLGRSDSFAALNAQLEAGGFSEERKLRLREGDIVVGAGDSVAARRVTLTADLGRIDIAGQVGRNTSEGGGRIELNAASGLHLAGGSQLLAAGSGAGARGGEVRVATRAGTLAFDTDARIDVRAGAAGPQGSVVFGVQRDAADRIGAVQLSGQVLRQATGGGSAASVDLEVTRVYEVAGGSSIGASQIASWAADHEGFVESGAGATLTAGLRDEAGTLGAGARVLGATEVQARGSLTLDANWDLLGAFRDSSTQAIGFNTDSGWRAGGLPGTLTLRAEGDLTLRQTLGAASLPTNSSNQTSNFNNHSVNHAVANGDSWNIRLAAGADLASTDALATRSDPSQGHVLLSGANAAIRTGSGRIDIAAAGDIRLDNVAQAIYTAGRFASTDTFKVGNTVTTTPDANSRWVQDGGGISLRAGGSVSGPANVPDLWVTDWLRRPRESAVDFTNNGALTDWWSYRPRFQQGVGTLGGGDIEVQAGANVNDLLFALPTSGRTLTTKNAAGNAVSRDGVEVRGGGDLRVQAGGNVNGASFLIGRGQGLVQAGGDIGSSTAAVQTYLMGYSSGAVPEQAQLQLSAGGSVVLQGSDNPTYLGLNTGLGAAGPSFHPSNPASPTPSTQTTTFFTYSANSALGLAADSGDITVRGSMAAGNQWRSVSDANVQASNISPNSAFPASLALLAFDRDIVGPGALFSSANILKTYPSLQASLVALAGGDIRGLAVELSDLAPTALITPDNRVQSARQPAALVNYTTGTVVSPAQKSIALGRITERDSEALPHGLVARDAGAEGLHFDIQAGGSILTLGDELLYLPARSRVLAGQDLVDPNLQLQNLKDGDLSEVRAVQGRIVKRNSTGGIEIGGPGQLLVQAGGDIDLGAARVTLNADVLGGLVATGNTRNALLGPKSARLTVLAGVAEKVDLARLDDVYARVLALNRASGEISSLYAQLALDLDTTSGRDAVLAAGNVAALVPRNAAYQRFVELDSKAPEALAAFQQVLRQGQLPLAGSDAGAAAQLLALLAREPDVARLASATSLRALFDSAAGGTLSLGGSTLDAATAAAYAELGDRYPRLFSGAVTRRLNGARLTGTTPLVFDELLASVTAGFVPATSAGGGSIFSNRTSIQTLGGSDIDLWAPAGNISVGLTSASTGQAVGVITNQGGAIRSVLAGDFSINTGKLLTLQGGDILLYSAQGSIDAGRGAKTSLATTAPRRVPVLDDSGNVLGYRFELPAAGQGSGIQTLTSDPDGLGVAVAPPPGDIYLFAPAGKIDAGEAGIRSSGNILINAQVVLNASDIRAAGNAQGVPQVPSGSLASALAAGGTSNSGGSQAAEQVAKAASEAARQAAAAPPPPKATVLSVEVMGFGDRNCKEDDKSCFAK